VSGKTQTIYPWDSWNNEYTAEPKVWFHDIFRPNGVPYDSAEVQLIRSITSSMRRSRLRTEGRGLTASIIAD
jgi:hypothetical protein